MTDLLEDMRGNPRKDWNISAVETICGQYGVKFDYPRGGGSHLKLSYPKLEAVLVMPFRQPIKPAYIRMFVKFIDTVKGLS